MPARWGECDSRPAPEARTWNLLQPRPLTAQGPPARGRHSARRPFRRCRSSMAPGLVPVPVPSRVPRRACGHGTPSPPIPSRVAAPVPCVPRRGGRSRGKPVDLAESRGAVPAGGRDGGREGFPGNRAAGERGGRAAPGPTRCRCVPGAQAALGSEPRPLSSLSRCSPGARRALEPGPARPSPSCRAPAAPVLQGKPAEEEEDRVTAGMIERLREMC